MKSYVWKKCLLIFVFPCFIFCSKITTKVETETVKSMILKEREDGNFFVEQIGKSIYVHFNKKIFYTHGSDWEIRRYMDITSILNADNFVLISKRIETIGTDISMYSTKAFTNFWEYKHSRFGRILISQEWLTYENPYPRQEIEIDNFAFVYYPKGNNIDIENYLVSTWNFDVPNYKEGHIYVRVVYESSMNSITDEELLEASREKIKNLKKL